MSVSKTNRDWKRVGTGLLWVGPNLLGFAAFTLVPLVFSLWMAVSDWDLTRHNFLMARQMGEAYQGPTFVGFDNFARLMREGRFWEYLGNTLFLMMGIPLSIAGSLLLAILLSRRMDGGGGRKRWVVMGSLVGGAAALVLGLLGLRVEAMVLMLGVVFATVLAMGATGGSTVYRTLFYLPHFTAGVAVFILWKRLYSVSGPINAELREPLEVLGNATRSSPGWLMTSVAWLLLMGAGWLAVSAVQRVRRNWADGDVGSGTLGVMGGVAMLPAMLAWSWWGLSGMSWAVGGLVGVSVAGLAFEAGMLAAGRFTGVRIGLFEGLGGALMSGLIKFVGAMILLGLGVWMFGLPELAAARNGLAPPDWLNSYAWAKPALMIMAFWTAVGSNNMLLYLAGISNVPPELYEAADIDGATGMQRFWNVTWPQLAPTTFFIFVMSVIGGLQGGFETARVMTEGGAGTTTISYFIYQSAFVDLALGYGSAVAWVLFALVFVVTVFNWKVGNQYVND